MVTRYSIETERLLLRPWRPEDRDTYLALAIEPEWSYYPRRRAATPDEAGSQFDHLVKHWRTHGFGPWAAVLKEGDTLIGYVGLAKPTWLPIVLPAVEVGWRLGSKWWGNGYATEAGRASLNYGTNDLLLDRIICIYEPGNTASVAVAARLGFREYMTTLDPNYPDQTLTIAEMSRVMWQRQAG